MIGKNGANELPIHLLNDLAWRINSASGFTDDDLGSLTVIRAVHSFLGGSESRDCSHQSFNNVKVVMMTIPRTPKQWLVKEALLTIWSYLSNDP